MSELVWDKTLSVSVDEIDEDHRRLVELLNLFNRSVAEGESPQYREAVLEELIACTVWHFRHEERLMLKYHYADITEHKAEHRELIENATAFQQKYLQDGGKMSDADFEYLEHWLTEHILVVDMKMGEWLAGVM
ncbi:bacteriohemerythrin [Sedimenticola hydrogenitrophicus]|uniref:bacteriohemerythrin n=1 Tax=Sedimenticola hydrogenitrophicus TaxID=2967975 RepID=UPI0023AF562E|nr:bacteriohemerythrin [Sedimenticola hydrogenitrophicus]